MNANALMEQQMRQMQKELAAQRRRQLQAAAYFHLQQEIARRSRARAGRALVRIPLDPRISGPSTVVEPALGPHWRIALLAFTLGVVAVALSGG